MHVCIIDSPFASPLLPGGVAGSKPRRLMSQLGQCKVASLHAAQHTISVQCSEHSGQSRAGRMIRRYERPSSTHSHATPMFRRPPIRHTYHLLWFVFWPPYFMTESQRPIHAVRRWCNVYHALVIIAICATTAKAEKQLHCHEYRRITQSNNGTHLELLYLARPARCSTQVVHTP